MMIPPASLAPQLTDVPTLQVALEQAQGRVFALKPENTALREHLWQKKRWQQANRSLAQHYLTTRRQIIERGFTATHKQQKGGRV
jgi:hypothetical protein